MDRIDNSEEVGLRFSHTFNCFSNQLEDTAEFIRRGLIQAWKRFACTVKRTAKYVSLGILYGTNSKEYRGAVRAYWRSRRNNQTVKRYKHGRTQRTRVKR